MNWLTDAEEMAHPLGQAEVKYIFAIPTAIAAARKGLEIAKISSKNGKNSRIWLLDDGDEMATVKDGREKDVRTLLGEEEEMELIIVKDAKERTALICYSSGTSGPPKGVELTH